MCAITWSRSGACSYAIESEPLEADGGDTHHVGDLLCQRYPGLRAAGRGNSSVSPDGPQPGRGGARTADVAGPSGRNDRFDTFSNRAPTWTGTDGTVARVARAGRLRTGYGYG